MSDEFKKKYLVALNAVKINSAKNMLELNLQFFASKQKQYGKKIGKHARDYGLDPSEPLQRAKMYEIINNIVENCDIVKIGPWRGQEKEVVFYIKGEDVVICSQENEFISILKGGIKNERVKNARIK